MTFWGVEVKPGKPYIHTHDVSRGKLRITQATIGNGNVTKRSVVQCNVGNKSPVLLCSLLPEKVESCSLDLEFEEEDEVIFSVVGPSSVHLTGYYYLGDGGLGDGDDTDSYGEDIAESESDEAGSYDSEDAYEDDFIDDSDMEIFPSSQRAKSGVVIEEIEDDDKPANGANNPRCPRKKNQIGDFDKADAGDRQIVVQQCPSTALESEDEDGFPISLTTKNKSYAKSTEKDRKADEVDHVKQENLNQEKTTNADDKVQPNDQQVGNIPDKNREKSEKSQKLKKKKKDKNKKGLESVVNTLVDKTNDGANPDQNNATETNMDQNHSEGDKQEGRNEKKMSSANNSGGKTDKKNKKKRCKEDVSPSNDGMLAETLDKDGMVDAHDADDSVFKKKRKNNNMDSGQTKAANRSEQIKVQEECQPQQTRTFPNGLIIEEVKMGKPDGKRASRGKKVSVFYIGKLKNGKIFDSNIGQRAFPFRLGVGEVIKGWDVGVEGMRIGDKRRLTIPPSMGYGSKGVGKIPPNSWLIFDVELVDVK